MDNNVLIVIDVQNDFVTGSLGSPEAVNIISNVVNKIKEFPQENVYYTQDTHYGDYPTTQEGQLLPVQHCIFPTWGWYIDARVVKELINANPIRKNTFGYTGWKDHLKDPTSITIIGLCTDICVVSNALILKALFPETPIIVDASCCAGTTINNHYSALEVMKQCQIQVINEDNSNES